MERSTAQRRLVKSPPELWAEISSETSLGRHLAEFGEIRITRVEPETTVAWEGDRASGTVELAPVGWGTKVILTATPLAEPASCAEPRVAAAKPKPAGPAQEPEPAAAAPERARPAPEPEPAAAAPERDPGSVRGTTDPGPVRATPSPEPARRRRGFLARWLRRLFKPSRAGVTCVARPTKLGIPTPPVPGPGPHVPGPDPSPPVPAPGPGPPVPAPDPTPPAPGPDPTPPDPAPPPPGPVPVPDPPPPDPDPVPAPPPTIRTPRDLPPAAASAPSPLDAERTVAILTGVLDDLGAAHRRLFFQD